MFLRFAFLAVVATIISSGDSLAEDVCSSGDSKTISFAIRSERNTTGHRHITTDVFLREAKVRKFAASGNIGLEVSQSTCTTSTERRTHLTSVVIVPEQRIPPPGYELVPGLGWYRLHLTPLTWEEARLACEAEGAHLAVLNSQEEAAALKGIFAKAPETIPGATLNSFVLIGMSDTAVEGTFITILGESLQEAGYSDWDHGEPNNGKTNLDPEQDCGAIYRSNGKLWDIGCSEKAAYFCEYAL